MMRISMFLMVSILLLSCNKEKRLVRFLQGSWTCSMVRYQDASGFTFYDSLPNGGIQIDETSVQGEVASQFNTFQGLATDSLVLNGTFALNLGNSELMWIQGQDTLRNRIFVITKTNLEFEYYDDIVQKRLRYVLVKE